MRCVAIVGFILLLTDAAVGEEKTGTIEGVVRFTGAVPPSRKIATGDGNFIDHNDLVVDAKTKGLRWVIAALEDAPAQPKLKATDSAEVIDQLNMVFVPRVIAVQHGRPIRFDNSDPCNHSVRTFSDLKENVLNVFVTAAQPVTKSFRAEKAPIQVGCALHSYMMAWIYVAPHPWVAVTDDKGTFTIKNVPPGKYTLWLKHPDTGVQERRQIEVKSGQKLEVAFEWKDAKPKREKK